MTSLDPSAVRRRLSIAVLAVAGCGLLGTACAKSDPIAAGAPGRGQVTVLISDDGCAATPATVRSGTIAFTVENHDSAKVSEAELRTQDLKSILGEQENLTPGLSGHFTLRLAAGRYKLSCPGAKQDTWDFTVTAGAKVADWKDDPALVKVTQGYSDYIEQQTTELQTTTAAFVAAVKAGDITRAKLLYGPARIHYEAIEPVADSFGDLDPLIDNRADDVTADELTGFHRLEYALWAQNSLAGMDPVADQLLADIAKLHTLVDQKSGAYVPDEVTAGATDLMNEVMTSKITGEEERYSHIDLVDFKANLDGSVEIVNLVRPILQQSDPALVKTLDSQIAAVEAALGTYAQQPGYEHTGYAEWGYDEDPHSTVTVAQRRALADVVKPLTASLGQIPVKVTV